MKIKVVFIAALLMTGCATTSTNNSGFSKGENLITPFTKELTSWKAYKKTEGNYNSVLWQNAEKGINDSLSVSVTYNEYNDLNKIKKTIDSPGYKKCDNFTTTSLNYTETGYPSIYWETLCTKGEFKAKTVHLMIQGNSNSRKLDSDWHIFS